MRGLIRSGQGLQDRVVVLARVGHPDQADVGRGEQQRADRAVHGAVGDVEDALGLCGGGEALAQPAQLVGGVGVGLRQVAGQVVVGAHRGSPFLAVTGG